MNKTIVQIAKKAGVSALILIGGAVLGYLLLFFAFFIRISPERAEQTIRIFEEQGDYPRASQRDGTTDHFHDYYPDVLDYFTDELIVRYSMETPDAPPLLRCLSVYGLYWHGYIVLLRPLLSIFDLTQVRTLNLAVQMLLAVYLSILLYAKMGKKRYSLAWFSAYAMLLPNCLGDNFQNSSIYYVGVIAAIVFLQFKDRFVKNYNYVFLFLIAGMCTSYFDFLTYPVMSFGIPAVMLVLFQEDIQGFRGVKKTVHPLLAFFTWGVGYLAFWSEKWIISDLLGGGSIFKTALGETHFRTSSGLAERILTVNKNWSYMAWMPIILIVAVWVILWMVHMIRKGLKKDVRVFSLASLWLVMLAWYLVASEHTRTHTIFAWRNAMIAVMSLLFIICITTENSGEMFPVKSLMSRITMVVITLITGVILFRIVPTNELSVMNYQSDGTTGYIPSGEKNALTFDFVPAHRVITQFELLLQSEDAEGYYEISLMDGEKTVYTTIAYSKDANAANVHYMKVFWPVKKGKHYSIRVSTEHMNDKCFIGYAYEDELPEVSANEAYPFMQVFYYTVPVEMRFILWNIITYVSLLLMCGYLILYVADSRAVNRKKELKPMENAVS